MNLILERVALVLAGLLVLLGLGFAVYVEVSARESP